MGRKARLDLVLDCAEPQAIETFWRDALGYRTYLSMESHVILVPDDHTNASPLGARRVHDGIQSIGDTRWVTLTDPIGNELCVCTGIEW